MKDKVSPMRNSSTRSTEAAPAGNEKLAEAGDHIKADACPSAEADSQTGATRRTGQKGSKDDLKITDLEKAIPVPRGEENRSDSPGPQAAPTPENNDNNTGNAELQSNEQPQVNEKSEENPRKRRSKPEVNMPKKNSKGVSHGASNWNKLRTIVQTTNVVKQKPKRKSNLHRQDSFLKKFSTRQQRTDSDDSVSNDDHNDYKWRDQNVICAVIHPDGTFMFYWLAIVTLAVLYNWWTCIAREGFREIQDGWEAVWFTFDGVCDTIYVLDIVVQFRTGYLEQGLMVYDSTKLRQNYYKSSNFYFDLISLFPLDLIQIFIGIHPMIRFPRFLKTYRTLRFMYMLESRAAYPNLFRVANLTHLLFLGSHWFAAFYYLISEAEGFVGDWAYPYPTGEFASVTRKYLMSLYWSTLTLTTIGDLPPPDSNWEYVFVIVSYLIGVFVFATIVGQVGNVITNRNASRQEFEKLLDGAKSYMRMHNVPPDLQKRVQRWYDYVWSRGRLNGSWDINSLGLLPDKLKTELALHVNLETLKKVTIFQECQPEFLHDLVLKMKAYIFTPGDLICRSGEIAREMFIIADGVVEVISESGTVLTQMSTGDFFGEIGILNLDGGINRRTADVRSVGYSELFVLSREDVLSALKDHPDAEQKLMELGRQRLLANQRKSEAVFPSDSSALNPALNGTTTGTPVDAITLTAVSPAPDTAVLKIIRDYGQQRLQEIEADRQKIKAKPIEDEEEAEAGLPDPSLLSPLKRHVHFNSYSPMARKKSQAFAEAKAIDRRKSCTVEYYRPRPVNGLVNFLQRKLSAGSAFCGVFQNPQLANQSRLHGGSGGHDCRRRTSSLAGSVDSISYDRDNVMRGILTKSYEPHNSTELSPTERPVRQTTVLAPPKHGFKGVHYSHIGSEDVSDSESSVYGCSFSEPCKLLPVKEAVVDEISASPQCQSQNSSISPIPTATVDSPPSDCDIQFPCVFSKSEASTKIANVFLQHLVNSQKLRRKSFDGRLAAKHNILDRTRFAFRRKTVYDVSESGVPFKTRSDPQTEAKSPVPSVVLESHDTSEEETESPDELDPDLLHSGLLPANEYSAPYNIGTVHSSNHSHQELSAANSETNSGNDSQVGASMGQLIHTNPRGRLDSGNREFKSPSRTSKVSLPNNKQREAQADGGMPVQKIPNQRTTEFRVEQLMGDVQGLIVHRLSEIAEGYMSKVKLLEDDNLAKDDRIQELEMKVRDLQIELSMAYRAEKS